MIEREPGSITISAGRRGVGFTWEREDEHWVLGFGADRWTARAFAAAFGVILGLILGAMVLATINAPPASERPKPTPDRFLEVV